ncbi:MAG: monovalent cation/H(+) antiporter subunit G [Akkermansiaceae bacterium]
MIFLISTLLIAGALFSLIAALGIIRMPDVFCRMHTATKAGAFGLTLVLLGIIAAAPEPRVIIQCALITIFFYLTAPIAAQMIGTIALRKSPEIWKNSAKQKK